MIRTIAHNESDNDIHNGNDNDKDNGNDNDNDKGEVKMVALTPKVFNPGITLSDIATLATVAEGTLKNFLKEIRDKQ